jgi:Rieske Fe-S protein
MNMESHSRRSFLKRLLGIAAALFAGLLSDRSQAGWFGGGSKERWVSIGKLTDLPDGKSMSIKTATSVPDGKSVKHPKLIAARRGDKVYVLSTRCTHFGCEVGEQADGSYLCPCHGAQFDKTGAVTKGPAKKNLAWCEVKTTEAGEVQVDMASSIEAPKLD